MSTGIEQLQLASAIETRSPFPIARLKAASGALAACPSFIVLAVLFFATRVVFCSWTIDYQWWKEMGQLHTWFSMLAYGFIPTAAGTLSVLLFSGSPTPRA